MRHLRIPFGLESGSTGVELWTNFNKKKCSIMPRTRVVGTLQRAKSLDISGNDRVPSSRTEQREVLVVGRRAPRVARPRHPRSGPVLKSGSRRVSRLYDGACCGKPRDSPRSSAFVNVSIRLRIGYIYIYPETKCNSMPCVRGKRRWSARSRHASLHSCPEVQICRWTLRVRPRARTGTCAPRAPFARRKKR